MPQLAVGAVRRIVTPQLAQRHCPLQPASAAATFFDHLSPRELQATHGGSNRVAYHPGRVHTVPEVRRPSTAARSDGAAQLREDQEQQPDLHDALGRGVVCGVQEHPYVCVEEDEEEKVAAPYVEFDHRGAINHNARPPQPVRPTPACTRRSTPVKRATITAAASAPTVLARFSIRQPVVESKVQENERRHCVAAQNHCCAEREVAKECRDQKGRDGHATRERYEHGRESPRVPCKRELHTLPR
mmetsp:Transcript_50028/g.104395  ORF Transcript_50028/g.104395 Transcript_50028/m.104395 type:complete len:244 (+) Transcript_50028:1354-2085(+)